METFKFKTNINCAGCIAAVTPTLNSLKGVQKWNVDTANNNKVLTVQTSGGLLPGQVISALNDKGFAADSI